MSAYLFRYQYSADLPMECSSISSILPPYMSWVKNDVNQFGLYLFSSTTPPVPQIHLMNLRLHHSVRKDQQQIALAEFYNGPGPITLSI